MLHTVFLLIIIAPLACGVTVAVVIRKPLPEKLPLRIFSVDEKLYAPPFRDEWVDNMDKTCWYQTITSITRFPCYREPWPMTQCQCGQTGVLPENRVTYVLPRHGNKFMLTKSILQRETIINFIHVNKAAGTTLKHILFNAAAIGSWDGAALGTRWGWHFRRAQAPFQLTQWRRRNNVTVDLPPPDSLDDMWSVVNDHASSQSKPEEIGYIRCGLPYSNSILLESFMQGGWFHYKCPFRLIWGGGAMGMCDHFPGQPCITVLALRDPLSRAMSDYAYFCTAGAEKRKKWDKTWKKCPLTPLQWFREMRTTPYMYVERLTLGCDQGCGLNVAIANLKHSCVRYLLTDQFNDGLEKLSNMFGQGAMYDAIRRYLAQPQPQNVHTSTTSPLSADELRELTVLLSEDTRLYREAVEFYQESWARPIVSCNVL